MATEVRTYPALRVLEKDTPPLRFSREPYWYAPVTPASANVHLPTWNWINPVTGTPEGEFLATLDVNGAYLAAASGVRIAHSHLKHTGRVYNVPRPRDVLPGYYRIIAPYWAFTATIVSPLGDTGITGSTVWISAPTLTLLLELVEEGALADVTIIDSYTATAMTDFRAWVAHLKAVRLSHLERIESAETAPAAVVAQEAYSAFKTGYSMALSLMLTPGKSKTYRPDWAHTVRAQHAATLWRKAWRYTGTGRALVAMGDTDTLTVLRDDLASALDRPTPPFRIDQSGRTLGHLKVKDNPAPPRRVTGPAPVPEGEDLF